MFRAALHYLSEVCGLSLDVGDNKDITPLHLVSAHGHIDALEYLLKKDVSTHNVLTSQSLHIKKIQRGNSVHVLVMLAHCLC